LLMPSFSHANQVERAMDSVQPDENSQDEINEPEAEFDESKTESDSNTKSESPKQEQDLDQETSVHKTDDNNKSQETEVNNNAIDSTHKINNTKDTIPNKKSKSTEPFSEGYRSDDVVELKKKLTKLGFGGMNLNDLYGSFTVTKVKQLQEYYGIQPSNGIANETTRNKIDNILSTSLQENKKHKSVIALKEKLITLGYGGMNLNEHYGSFTTTKVKQFQRDNGLIDNGLIDPVTQNRLDNLFPSVLKQGVRSPLVIDLKKQLIKLGFGGMNLNEHYGSFTATRVRQLQEYFNIKPFDGIVGNQTSASIDAILLNSFDVGDKGPEVIEIKRNLINLGYGGMNLNEHYGSFTATRI